MFMPAVIAPQPPRPVEAWMPLDYNRVIRHFLASRDLENIPAYIAAQEAMPPDERLILFFLHAIYEDSLQTIEVYARYIIGLFNHTQKSFQYITAQDIDAYVRYFNVNGAKPNTINTIAAALKSFFKHLVASGLLTYNPTAFLKKKRKKRSQSLPGHLSHSLAHEEISAFFDSMARSGAPFRDIVLFKLLYFTGLRAAEAVSLKWRDLIQWQGNWYIDVLGKGSKARRVYLPEKILGPLMEFRSQVNSSPDRPMFGNLRSPDRHITRHGLYYQVKKWASHAIARKDISPHWFRHSCFTQMALMGARVESIQDTAGHESIETSMQYNEAAKMMKPAGMVFDNIGE